MKRQKHFSTRKVISNIPNILVIYAYDYRNGGGAG